VRQQLAVCRHELVESSAEGALKGERQGLAGGDHPRELDDEEWVPLRAVDAEGVGSAGVAREGKRVAGLEGPEVDEEPVAARTKPGGLCEFRTCRRDEEEWPTREGQPVDESHRGLVGPVQILEPHDRHRVAARREVAPPGVDDLVGALLVREAAQLLVLGEPGAVQHRPQDAVPLGGILDHRERRVHLCAADVRSTEQPAKRRSRAGLAQRPESREERHSVDLLEELPHHTGLALSRRAADESEHRALRATPVGHAQDLDVADPAHEGQVDTRLRPAGRLELPHLHRVEAFERHRPERAESGHRARHRVARRPDQDLSRLRRLLQPRRGVHDGADAHLLVCHLDCREIDDGLAGLYADPEGEGRSRSGGRGPARVRGAERAQRVVRVRGGGAEERVDGVADVLLDDPALRADLRAHLLEGVGERPLQALGAEACRERGRADDVDEDAGDEAALFAGLRHRVRVRKPSQPARQADADQASVSRSQDVVAVSSCSRWAGPVKR